MQRQLTHDDLKLLKSALRRAFARSDVHKAVEDAYRIEHSDPKHPRCQKWSWCAQCGEVVPTWRTQVDHKDPVQPLGVLLQDMTPIQLYERIWCDPSNLWVLCTDRCHAAKSKAENAERRRLKSVHKAA